MLTVNVPARPRFWQRLRPRIVAVFSHRYDSHLVPDLLANISPAVDGWISWDDRQASEAFSSEPARRRTLVAAAHESGADWVLAIDPDERIEPKAASRLRVLTLVPGEIAWTFGLREMFSADSYRIDGRWGNKTRRRMFPIHGRHFGQLRQHLEGSRPLHDDWMPRGFRSLPSGLDLYHLKMITSERRQARSDLYRRLDPEMKMQRLDYGYLADETGAQFRQVPAKRMFRPAHVEDGGLWMPDPASMPKGG